MATKAQLTQTIEALRLELDTLRLISAADAARLEAAGFALAQLKSNYGSVDSRTAWKRSVDERGAKMQAAKVDAQSSKRWVAV